MITEWTGSVRDLVRYAASTDARETVRDSISGALIRINIDGLEGATAKDEPFYIEYGKELYDAYNRKEAAVILANIRRGEKHPDMWGDGYFKRPHAIKTKKRVHRRATPGVGSSR